MPNIARTVRRCSCHGCFAYALRDIPRSTRQYGAHSTKLTDFLYTPCLVRMSSVRLGEYDEVEQL